MLASLNQATMMSLFKTNPWDWRHIDLNESLRQFTLQIHSFFVGKMLRKSQEWSPASHLAEEKTGTDQTSRLNFSALAHSPEIFIIAQDVFILLRTLFRLLPRPSPPRALCGWLAPSTLNSVVTLFWWDGLDTSPLSSPEFVFLPTLDSELLEYMDSLSILNT